MNEKNSFHVVELQKVLAIFRVLRNIHRNY